MMASTTDSLAAIVTWLYAQVDWPSGVTIDGLELAAGWQPRKSVLVMPDGPGFDIDLPVISEIVTLWCYGATAEDGRIVADAMCGLIHRARGMAISLSAKTVYVGPGEILTGPAYVREPETLWHRWIVRARIRVSEIPA